jgi:hypothetical protein
LKQANGGTKTTAQRIKTMNENLYAEPAKLAAEFSPLGCGVIFCSARFSGRQILSPAEAGSGNSFCADTQGSASLHFVPLRLPWAKFCRRLRRLVDRQRISGGREGGARF